MLGIWLSCRITTNIKKLTELPMSGQIAYAMENPEPTSEFIRRYSELA
jgi:hypothetical protein